MASVKLPTQGDRKLITGGQGTGKSREADAAIAELRPGMVIWWTAPTLDTAEEQIAEDRRMATPATMPVTVVRGRGADDPQQAGKAMCPRHRAVNRAAAPGVDVQKAGSRATSPPSNAATTRRTLDHFIPEQIVSAS